MSGGIIIDIGGDDNHDIDRKANEATKHLDCIGRAMQSITGGGFRGGVNAALQMAGMAGTSTGTLILGGAALATTAALAIHKAAADATEKISSYYSAGAAPGERGLMNMGPGAEGMAAMANRLAENLRGPGLAAGWARSEGLLDFGWATKDKMTNLIKALDELRKVQDSQWRMYLTRELVGPEAGSMVELGDNIYKTVTWLEKGAQLNERQLSELAGVNATIKSGWDYTVAGVQELIADFVDTKFNWVNFINTMKWSWTTDFSDILPGTKDGDSTTREHTEAMKQHTRALNNEHIHMGRRATTAWPKGWKAMQAEDAMKDQARRLGGI